MRIEKIYPIDRQVFSINLFIEMTARVSVELTSADLNIGRCATLAEIRMGCSQLT